MSIHTLHISGMHCPACVAMVERQLGSLPGVSRIKASLAHHQIEIEGSFDDCTREQLIVQLEPAVAEHGYHLSAEKPPHQTDWREFLTALPLALLLLGGFATLQKAGLANLLTMNEISYPAAFLIGIVASLSSCMAIAGGLTLSVSASYAREDGRPVPQILFHTGRLATFFLLGGVLGIIGENFRINMSMTLWLNMAVAIIMLLLGLNLLDIFHWPRRLLPTLPSFITHHLLQMQNLNHTLTPLLLGAVTFFLPCGFTQSMQLYALGSGSFTTGSLTLLAFALGTLPVLATLSFASLAIRRYAASGVFFKTAGLIVIAFGLFSLLNGLAVAGI